MFLLGLQAAAWRVPFLPTRVGLGSDVMRLNPRSAHGALAVRRRRGARRDARARRSTSRSIHMHRGDQGGTGQYLERRPLLRRPVLHGRAAPVHGGRAASSTPTTSCKEGPPQSIRINRLMTDGVVETPHGAHFTECVPDYPRDEAFQKAYAATREERRGLGRVPGQVHRRDRSRVPAAAVSGRDAERSSGRRLAPRCARSRSPTASAATARSSPTRSARCR